MIRRLTRLLGRDASRLRAFLCWSVAANALRGATFALVVPVVARLVTGDVGGAAAWLATLAVCATAATAAGYLASVRGFDTAIALLRTIRERIGDHVVTLPVGWFTPERTGRLRVTLSQGVMDLTSLPAHRLEPLIQAIVTPAVLTVGIAIVDLRLAGVLAVCLPLLAGALAWAATLGRRADARVAATTAEAAERMVEFSRVQPLLRIDRHGLWRRRFDQTLVDLRRAERRQLLLVLPPVVVNGSVSRLAFLALMGTVATLSTGADSVEGVVSLVALLAIVNRVVEPISDLAGHGAALRMSSANLREVEALLDARPLPQPDRPSMTPTRFDIALTGVTFGYRPDEPVLHDVTMAVPEGSMTALVGASGSGKTTVTKLVARFWDPTTGSVRIGGTDLRDLRDEQIAGLVAPVFQDAYLLPGTLRDNLLLARPDTDAATFEEVADLARVSEIVARLPDGWDTVVGDGGVTLSGGERQRVTIARALLKQAPIVLLDEATGALDAENQAAITAGLAALRGRCTLLVVAHQLSTITGADRIVVLDAGRVVEVGTHETLLAAEGHYAASWAALTGAAGWHPVTPGASGDR